eukprot:UN04422
MFVFYTKCHPKSQFMSSTNFDYITINCMIYHELSQNISS